MQVLGNNTVIVTVKTTKMPICENGEITRKRITSSVWPGMIRLWWPSSAQHNSTKHLGLISVFCANVAVLLLFSVTLRLFSVMLQLFSVVLRLVSVVSC